MNLRVARLVQIMHVIEGMQEAEIKLRQSEISWQTRAMCMFIASTVEDDKARTSLMKEAQKLSLTDDDDTTSEGPKERTLEDIIENGSVAEALERNNRRAGPGLESLRFSR